MTARAVGLFCLGISSLVTPAVPSAQGRPIEFSEPSGPAISTNSSNWGGPSGGLTMEDQMLRPNSFNSGKGLPNSLKPLSAFKGARVQGNRGNQGKNWTLMTPDEMMQSMIQKETLKLPQSKADPGELTASSSVEQYYWHLFGNKSATNRLGASDLGGSSSETNAWGNLADGLNANHPFAAQGRRPDRLLNPDLKAVRPNAWSDLTKSADDLSPDAGRERNTQAGQIENYRNASRFQPPGINPAFHPSGAGRSVNPLAPLPGSSFSSQPGRIDSVFTPPSAPAAPTAPTAPLAPGQTSLAPAPYSAPAKPKSLIFSAPQRKF